MHQPYYIKGDMWWHHSNKPEYDLIDLKMYMTNRSSLTFELASGNPKMYQLHHIEDDLMCCVDGIMLTRSFDDKTHECTDRYTDRADFYISLWYTCADVRQKCLWCCKVGFHCTNRQCLNEEENRWADHKRTIKQFTPINACICSGVFIIENLFHLNMLILLDNSNNSSMK